MTNLLSQTNKNEPIELTAYLCPQPWQPPGLIAGERCKNTISIQSDENDENVKVEVYLCPQGYQCEGLEVTVYLLKEDKTVLDCFLCFGAERRIVYEGGEWKGEVERPDEPCAGECEKRIHWYQEYHIEYSDWYQDESGIWKQKEIKVPEPWLKFEINPTEICSLREVVLMGEVSGLLAGWYFSGTGAIPEDNSLKFLYNNPIILQVSLSDQKPFPGELIQAWGLIDDFEIGQCNPLVLGWCYFETYCFTSAEVKGFVLVNEEGQVLERSYSNWTPDEWIGDERLRYEVLYKGKTYYLRASDWARYGVGGRCVIYKGGYSQTEEGLQEGCRGPVPGLFNGGILPQAGEPISDSNVSYELNEESDIIIPQTFWGMGA